MRADQDVPSPIDFHDPAQARAWVDDTVRKRPWRPRFFEAFADALNRQFDRPISVAELGSGPGHLARVMLERCSIGDYRALDFSAAMHALARDHIGGLIGPVSFVTADFREPRWIERAAGVDALITMQAAHEVRHRRHLPALLGQMHQALGPGGLLLFCDHYAEAGSEKNDALFVEREVQPALIQDAGFVDVKRLLDQGGMALYSARISKGAHGH